MGLPVGRSKRATRTSASWWMVWRAGERRDSRSWSRRTTATDADGASSTVDHVFRAAA